MNRRCGKSNLLLQLLGNILQVFQAGLSFKQALDVFFQDFDQPVSLPLCVLQLVLGGGLQPRGHFLDTQERETGERHTGERDR